MSTALLPASEARSAPHMWVRRRSPKKSSKLCLSVGKTAQSRIRDYKWLGSRIEEEPADRILRRQTSFRMCWTLVLGGTDLRRSAPPLFPTELGSEAQFLFVVFPSITVVQLP